MLVPPLAVPALLYIILSVPGVQKSLGHKAEKELTTLLGTEVKIGGVDYSPFTRIVLKDVSVNDTTGREALHIGHLGAGVSIGETLWNKRLIITYAEIIDMQPVPASRLRRLASEYRSYSRPIQKERQKREITV